MAEYEDRSEMGNVAEAENLSENVNIADTKNVTQNENVGVIEDTLENKDLDQYLLHPRNTWAYDIMITVHCKLKLIHAIKEVLGSCCELEEFKKSCFEHYLDMPHYMSGLFQAQYIHNLLLHQILFLGARDDEMCLLWGTPILRLGEGWHPHEIFWWGRILITGSTVGQILKG
ncbi:hypothetical protein Ddye_012740 [Dipteronia dyeriana]|uniref:Uncharacterized protein n=1 Tax=Dipteronia dyeriana TaxID=168575 RepID=A0AAE0CIZ4_9ROSI|nr:hypothetical protein Ddye_012740 [Dipteronia dyeriana]